MTNPQNAERVVFFWDSIRDAWNLEQFFPGKGYVSRAMGGQTTPQMSLRFRQDLVALKAMAVVSLAGTNDVAENKGPASLQRL
jgi:hypothetical protein